MTLLFLFNPLFQSCITQWLCETILYHIPILQMEFIRELFLRLCLQQFEFHWRIERKCFDAIESSVSFYFSITLMIIKHWCCWNLLIWYFNTVFKWRPNIWNGFVWKKSFKYFQEIKIQSVWYRRTQRTAHPVFRQIFKLNFTDKKCITINQVIKI